MRALPLLQPRVRTLGLGIFAMACIAVSGAYTHAAWPMSNTTTLALRGIGWSLAALLFLWLLYSVRSGLVVTTRQVLLSSILLASPLLLAQPIFAGDVYAYVAGARVSAIGNPYVLTPSTLGSDAILSGVAPAWRGQPSAYGPLWNVVSAGLGKLTASDVALFTTFRLLALAGVLACTWLLSRHASPALAGLVAFNPIVLVDAVADGHHDILVGLALLAAVLWLRRPARSAFALAVATALKFVPVIVAPVLVLSAPPGKRNATALWVSLATLGLLAACFLPFWVGGQTFDGLRQQASLFSHPAFFPQFLVFIFAYLSGSSVHPELVARSVGLLAFVVAYTGIVLAAWRQRLAPAAAVALTLGAYIFLGAPYVQTWYLLWLLPLLPLLPSRHALRWVMVATLGWGAMLLVH